MRKVLGLAGEFRIAGDQRIGGDLRVRIAHAPGTQGLKYLASPKGGGDARAELRSHAVSLVELDAEPRLIAHHEPAQVVKHHWMTAKVPAVGAAPATTASDARAWKLTETHYRACEKATKRSR